MCSERKCCTSWTARLNVGAFRLRFCEILESLVVPESAKKRRQLAYCDRRRLLSSVRWERSGLWGWGGAGVSTSSDWVVFYRCRSL